MKELTKDKIAEILDYHDACDDAVEYIERSKSSISKLYDRTSRGCWLLFLARATKFPFSIRAARALKKTIQEHPPIYIASIASATSMLSSDLGYEEMSRAVAKVFKKHVSKKKFFKHLAQHR